MHDGMQYQSVNQSISSHTNKSQLTEQSTINKRWQLKLCVMGSTQGAECSAYMGYPCTGNKN